MAKTKLKPVLPSLKEKKRYLVFEVISKGSISDFNSVTKAIWHKSLSMLGQIQAAEAGIWMFPDCWDNSTNKGMIRVGHKYVDQIKASLAMINHVEDNEAIVRTIGVSGTMAKAKSKFMVS